MISLLLGAARGATIELFPKDGYLWQRYRAVTVALWGAYIAAKLLLMLVAHLAGVHGGSDLLLSLGLSLAGEAALVVARAMLTGAPFATDPKDSGAEDSDSGRPKVARAEPLGALTSRAGTPAMPGWDNQARMPTSTRNSTDGQGDTSEWRSPTWRDGLDWVRDQVAQPGRSDQGRR